MCEGVISSKILKRPISVTMENRLLRFEVENDLHLSIKKDYSI